MRISGGRLEARRMMETERSRLVKKYGSVIVEAAEQFGEEWSERLIKGTPTSGETPRGILT